VAERARLERDGDVGVLVIDHEPLNLFDAQMVREILAGLDQTGGCRALLVRAEGKYFTGGRP
jgi:enoyl-CoA hydratase/carnithine racemase